MSITALTIPPISPFSLTKHYPSSLHTQICRHSPLKFHEFSSKSPVSFNGVRCMHPNNIFRNSLPPIKVDGFNSMFMKVGPRESHSKRIITVNSSMGEKSEIGPSSLKMVFDAMHLIISLGIILAMDKFLKNAFMAAGVKFPSALFGMFCIFSVLTILDLTVPKMATKLMCFFEPALMFIQRWLPLFYVPSLVVLPLAVKDIPAASGLKICFIIVGGWLASLAVAGYTAIAVRNIVKTEMTDAEPMAKPAPFSSSELWIWSGVFLISFVVALIYPTLLGTSARTCLPFLLSSTVLGYMVGSG